MNKIDEHMKKKLDLVDENENIIKTLAFGDYFADVSQGISKGSAVFVFETEKLERILIIKRSSRIPEPGKYCIPGGYVESRNNFDETAKKELQEEALGNKATDLKLTKIGKFLFSNPNEPNYKSYVSLYFTIFPGPFYPDFVETESCEFNSIKKLKKKLQQNPENYTEAFKAQFKFLMENFPEHSEAITKV